MQKSKSLNFFKDFFDFSLKILTIIILFFRSYMQIFRCISKIFFILVFFILFTLDWYAAINFTVTPIRYEFSLAPGESLTSTASIRNNGTGTVTLPTTASDFQVRDTGWTPQIVRKSELVYPEQELSSWITISEASVTLAAWEEKTVNFTINVPSDATPGGKYGAVLFKNDNSAWSGSGNIGINVDYGVIILLEVKGDIIVDIEIEDPIVQNRWGGTGRNRYNQNIQNENETSENTSEGSDWDNENNNSWVSSWDNSWLDNIIREDEINNTEIKKDIWYVGEDTDGTGLYQIPDNCLFWDFTKSRYDGVCFWKEPKLFSDSEPKLFESDFTIRFSIPIDNKGNIHVKPRGKITLKDENGNILKNVGKEIIANEFWAVMREEVVDYIPINDNQWNVLPGSKRVFESDWRWFPYQSYDEEWNIVIKYWTPSEYYTKESQRDSWYMMPWERLKEVRQTKNITADIEVIYQDENGEDIVFNAAKEFPVQYIEQKIGLNPYILLGTWLLLLTILMIFFWVRWWFLIAKTKKCWNCKEKIKSHWETCPYCHAVQNKRKHKKLEKLKKA